MPKTILTIERKIYFYRVHIGIDDNGLPLPFDPRPALSIINQLSFAETDGRYLTVNEGAAVCGWIDDQGLLPRMRFGQIRRAGLPQIEQCGNLLDLDIDADAGLVEPIHIVFFPENVVGVDFNFYGPRLSRLGQYLQAKCGDYGPRGIWFSPLLRNDVVAQLDHLGDIRLFDLKIRTTYVDSVRQADEDLGAAFDAARRVGNTGEIEVVIRPAIAGRRTIKERLIGIARCLARQGDLRTESSRFVIRGKRDDSGRVQSIDLLHDHLISKKQIVRLDERSRALDMNSAYDAIRTAFGELGDELRTAPSVSS